MVDKIGHKIKVIITDDSISFVEGLKEMLKANSKIDVIATYSNGKELLDSGNVARADLLLLDIDMPVLNGIDTASKICFVYPEIPMIAITTNRTTVFLKEVILAGFKGFVYKTEIHKDLHSTIDKVLKKKFVFPKDLGL